MRRILKYFLVWILFVGTLEKAGAQTLLHVTGNAGVDVGYYFAGKDNFSFMAGYAGYLSNKFILKSRLIYEGRKIGYVDYSRYNGYIIANYTVKSFFDRIFLNADGGLLAGFESIKNDQFKSDVEFKTTETNFHYGILVGIEIEYFLIEQFAFIFGVNQQLNFKSKLGMFHYQVGAGIRLMVK